MVARRASPNARRHAAPKTHRNHSASCSRWFSVRFSRISMRLKRFERARMLASEP